MDQVVGQALAMFDKLSGARGERERIVVPAATPIVTPTAVVRSVLTSTEAA